MDWNALRNDEFPVARAWAYFDHAAVAPLPKRSANALRAWADDQERNGDVHWPDWERKAEAVRSDAARLLRADATEIAFVNSTTHGITLIAEGFPWRAGENVVTLSDEYPSNIYPWLNLADRGVSLRLVPCREGRVSIDEIAEAIDADTRLLTISHVEFASGFRNDLDKLGALCRDRGIAFFVDAIQGLGMLEIDVSRSPIDFLAADGHKWLLGPEGAGILWVRREWIERLRPIGVGWHSVIGSFNAPSVDFRLKPTAQRWEGGSFNMPGIQALGASLGLFLEIGPAVVSNRILETAALVRDRLKTLGWTIHGPNRPEDESAIVAIEREGVDPDRIVRHARERGIALAARRGRVRISPHLYNNAEDVDRLCQALSEATSGRRPENEG